VVISSFNGASLSSDTDMAVTIAVRDALLRSSARRRRGRTRCDAVGRELARAER